MAMCLRYVLTRDSVIPLGRDRSSFAKVNPNMSACAKVRSLGMEVLQPNSRSDMVVGDMRDWMWRSASAATRVNKEKDDDKAESGHFFLGNLSSRAGRT